VELKSIEIDIETYSDVDLSKCGVYRYVQSPVFEILLFGYSVDGGAVEVIDLACGEEIPADILAALSDESVTKWAFNAIFERVCLSQITLGNGWSRNLGNAPWSGLPPWDFRCLWKMWAQCLGWKNRS